MALSASAPEENNVFDVLQARADFPVLGQTRHGKRLVFLDSAASAQKPQQVIDSTVRLYGTCYANVHRGLYSLSQETTRAFEAARQTVARFINAPENTVVFTRNATEAINLVAASWGAANLQRGDEILLTELEHHANIVPWQMIAQRTGAELVVVPVTPDGDILAETVIARMGPRTKIMAISHMSNALGTILPVAELVAEARARGIVTLLDGCQAVTHMPVDVAALGCDFYVFSGHKLYGPTGIGVLYGRAEILNAMPPYQGGGDMIETVRFTGTSYKPAPARFEAGTPAIAEAIALGAAIDYLQRYGMAQVTQHENVLYNAAYARLSNMEGVTVHGRAAQRASILSFSVDWAHPSDIATVLDHEGVCVRVGHHCCMPLMEALGVTATIRASLGLYSTVDDLEAFFAALEKSRRFFG